MYAKTTVPDTTTSLPQTCTEPVHRKEPRTVYITEIPAIPPTKEVEEPPPAMVVVDGSVFNEKKPYLYVTLGNHTVHPTSDDEIGFDANSNRLISFVSVHDRCGVIVSSKKHMSALQNLGYPVVLWGQTFAFPMSAKDIKRSGTGEPYNGALVVHTFTEPMSMHNRENIKTGLILGDGTFDGLNHLAGAYIPLALALQCATGGDTHVNLVTKNSGVQLQEHSIDLVVGGNYTSLCFKDKCGGAIAPDNVVTACANCESDSMPLVVGKRQLNPEFDKLVQEMSASKSSFMTALMESVGVSIGNGMFAQYDKQLEADIRTFITKGAKVDDTGKSIDASTPLRVNMCDLSEKLQTEYCTASMVGMKQPFPIAAPTVVVEAGVTPVSNDATGVESSTPTTNSSQASLYGDRFNTCSYALEPHFNLESGRDIHNKTGILALAHALFLSQISLVDAENVCKHYANPDSKFLQCKNPSCECNAESVIDASVPQKPEPKKPGSQAVSTKFERMLLGVSQNIALSSMKQNSRTGLSAMTVPVGISKPKQESVTSTPTPQSSKCTATTDFKGNCMCIECVNTSKFLHLGQLVASSTHAFQKCDNYVSDQTVCSINTKGVPQYKPTESMLPFMSVSKSIMMKNGPGGVDDVVLRVGMNTDDCENCAFESKAVVDTLESGAKCVQGDLFHISTSPTSTATTTGQITTDETTADKISTDKTSTDKTTTDKTTTDKTTTDKTSSDPTVSTIAADEEVLRRMYLGSLGKQDQRRMLLCAETLGKIQVNLGYFVTGSASQASDKKEPSTHSGVTESHPQYNTVQTCNVYSPCTPSVSSKVVDLPENVGSGLKAFGEKTPGRQLVHETTDKSTSAEPAQSGLSGHCTCTLSITRKDGFLQTTVVEGTAHVLMSAGDIPCEVSHRGIIGAPSTATSEGIGVNGTFNAPITVDNSLDMTVNALLSCHVNTISSRLQVPESNLRPCVFMGTSEKVSANMDVFYKKIVSTGAFQCIQTYGDDGIEPGADVKSFVNQRVIPIVPLEIASKGQTATRKAMGAAKCAMVEVVDTKGEKYQQFARDCKMFSRAMSPLRFSPENQERYMLDSLGAIPQMQVNFPDSAKLAKKHGKCIRTFFVTTVAKDDSPAGRAKVLKALKHQIAQMNNDYVNVRVASPVIMASGEMVTLYRIYGVPLDPLLP